MKFTFENQGTNTYLVYTVQPEDTIDTMSLGMLTNNKILGLAPTQFMQMDTVKYIKYNVSARVSAKQFFSGAVNKKRLIGVFKGIVNAMLSAEDYMIDIRTIVMDMDYIFADVSTCETVLVCLPITKIEQNPVDLRGFFKTIVFSTQFDQTENCDHVAKIINYLNGTPSFSLTDFKQLLEEIDGQKVQPVVMQPTPQPAPQPAVQPDRQPQTAIARNPMPVQNTLPVQNPTAQKNSVQVPPGTLPKAFPGGVAVPPVPSQKTPAVPPAPGPKAFAGQAAPQTPGPEISFLYLMQHYNKENAAAYKAQKEAKKRAAAAAKGKQPPAKKKGRPAAPPAGSFNFAVPGQGNVQPPVQPRPQPQPQPQPVAQPAAGPAPLPQAGPYGGNMPPARQPYGGNAPQPPVYAPRPAPQGQSADFGETTVLGGGTIGETTVLTAAQNPAKMVAPHLIREKNQEKISVNKPVFRVGKEKSYVDYFIGDNTAISRSHANLITRDGAYFIVDTNSTNHTFVNGVMIQSNVETPIAHGDKIRMANEDFEFRLY